MSTPSPDRAEAGRLKTYVGQFVDLLRDLPPTLRYGGAGMLAYIILVVPPLNLPMEWAAAGIAGAFVAALVAHVVLEFRNGPEHGLIGAADVPAAAGETPAPLPKAPDDGRLRVGVLSFAEVGGGADQQAYGDGFTEELITRLTRIEELNLVPRRSMMVVKEQRLLAPQIAAQLGTHYLVDGTLRTHGDRCRVDVGVIRAEHNEYAWREQWERPWAELFELQSAVAERVAGYLLGVVRPGAEALHQEERTALRRDPTTHVGAHAAYMRGRANLRRFNNGREEVHFRAAERAFKEALDIDPDYVDAQAELGFLYLLQWETDGGPAWLERSELAFLKVDSRQADHPMALSELGYVAFVRGDTERALRLAERSAALHPEDTIPQNVLALLYMYIGFYEAAVHLTETRVTPLDPMYIYPATNASTCALLMGRLQDALRWARTAEDIDPSAFIAPLVEGAAHFHRGDYADARAAWQRGLDIAPDDVDLLFDATLAWIAAAEGDLATARAAVAAHRDDPWLDGAYDPYFISLCALAGEHDLAVDLLERQTTYAGGYRYLVSDPTLLPLRDHPGFRRLLHRRHADWTALEPRWEKLPIPPAPPPTPSEFLARAPAGS